MQFILTKNVLWEFLLHDFKGHSVNNFKLQKIRKCFKPEEVDWQLALKVATLYGKHRYFSQALKALEPFVLKVDLDSDTVLEEVKADGSDRVRLSSLHFAMLNVNPILAGEKEATQT